MKSVFSILLILSSTTILAKDVFCLAENKNSNDRYYLHVNFEKGQKNPHHWSADGPKAPIIKLYSYAGEANTIEEFDSAPQDGTLEQITVVDHCNISYDPIACRNDKYGEHTYYVTAFFAAPLKFLKNVNWKVGNCHGNPTGPLNPRREVTFGPTLPDGQGPVPEEKQTACFIDCKYKR